MSVAFLMMFGRVGIDYTKASVVICDILEGHLWLSALGGPKRPSPRTANRISRAADIMIGLLECFLGFRYLEHLNILKAVTKKIWRGKCRSS